MMPATFPMELYRGDTGRWQFKFWTDASKTVPLDLTGSTPKAEIRDTYAGDVVMVLACQLTAPNIVNVTLAAALWAAWTHKKGVWDLQVTYGNGDVFTFVAGPVTVAPDVTDSEPLPLGARPR